MKNPWLLYIAIPLILSGFTHLWNPAGFPDIFFDEGVYMRRAMHVLTQGNPQEAYHYDHPFFGQILLGSYLQLVDFPEIANPTMDQSSIKRLYEIPRIFMGLLAVIDTFLIYKIAEKKFNKNVALISSLLFAVMPFTWIFRRILLDSLLLPFLLLSILAALNTKEEKNRWIYILISGISLGLAIFTKIPIFTMVPLVSVLIFYNTKNLKMIGVWFIPVIFIPLIWPLYSISVDQFDLWTEGVLWQVQRTHNILEILGAFIIIDPLLFAIGFGGIIFSILRKNTFIILWFAPFVLFLSVIGFKQYFHWIPIIPVLCIGGALLINEIATKGRKILNQRTLIFVVLSIGLFGLISTSLLITNDVTKSQFEAAAFVINNVDDSDTTVFASPVYTWIFQNVYHLKNVPKDYSMILYEQTKTKNILLITDQHFFIDIDRGPQLQALYDNTKTVKSFEGDVLNFNTDMYPYSNMKLNYEGGKIEIRTGKLI